MIKPSENPIAGRSAPPSPAEQTRSALVHAGLKLFGRQGFDGTSTREIAALAKANIGSIAYHFGSKEGLRLAAADYIVDMIQTIAGQALGTPDTGDAAAAMPEQAEAQLRMAVEAMVGFIVARPEAGEIVQFLLRELSNPTAALDRIYTGVFEPVHQRFCRTWALATGEDAESERTKLTVFTLIGQVVYFRIAREAVLRRMGWSEIGAKQALAIAEVAGENVATILKSRKVERS